MSWPGEVIGMPAGHDQDYFAAGPQAGDEISLEPFPNVFALPRTFGIGLRSNRVIHDDQVGSSAGNCSPDADREVVAAICSRPGFGRSLLTFYCKAEIGGFCNDQGLYTPTEVGGQGSRM